MAVNLIGSSVVKQQMVLKKINELHNETKVKALEYAKFRIFPLICPFRRLYSLRFFFEKNSKLLIYRPFDVKIHILKDLTFRLEVRKVILYLLLTEV